MIIKPKLFSFFRTGARSELYPLELLSELEYEDLKCHLVKLKDGEIFTFSFYLQSESKFYQKFFLLLEKTKNLKSNTLSDTQKDP